MAIYAEEIKIPSFKARKGSSTAASTSKSIIALVNWCFRVQDFRKRVGA